MIPGAGMASLVSAGVCHCRKLLARLKKDFRNTETETNRTSLSSRVTKTLCRRCVRIAKPAGKRKKVVSLSDLTARGSRGCLPGSSDGHGRATVTHTGAL